MNYSQIIGKDCIDIINDYKNQLEHFENYKKSILILGNYYDVITDICNDDDNSYIYNCQSEKFVTSCIKCSETVTRKSSIYTFRHSDRIDGIYSHRICFFCHDQCEKFDNLMLELLYKCDLFAFSRRFISRNH